MKRTKPQIKGYAVLFWLLLWELGSRVIDQEILLVSPFSVLRRLWELGQQWDFYRTLLFSTGRILWGFLLAELAAGLSAFLSARNRIFRAMLAPLLFTIRCTPVASFTILILFWFSARRMPFVISFLMAFPVLYENLMTGISEVDRKLLEMAEVFRIPRWESGKTIWLSALMPYFTSGSVTALGLSWKAGIAAEVIGIPKYSIGEMLYNAKVYLDTPDLFAWTLMIVLLSLGTQTLFSRGLSRFHQKLQQAL